MGFWNVRARDLQEGDEIRVRVMGGEEFLTVLNATEDDDGVHVRMEWGLHVPVAEPIEDLFPPEERLTVRR